MPERVLRLCVGILIPMSVFAQKLSARVQRLVRIVSRLATSVGFDVRVAVDGAEGLLVVELGDVTRDDEAAV